MYGDVGVKMGCQFVAGSEVQLKVNMEMIMILWIIRKIH